MFKKIIKYSFSRLLFAARSLFLKRDFRLLRPTGQSFQQLLFVLFRNLYNHQIQSKAHTYVNAIYVLAALETLLLKQNFVYRTVKQHFLTSVLSNWNVREDCVKISSFKVYYYVQHAYQHIYIYTRIRNILWLSSILIFAFKYKEKYKF